MNNQLPDYDQLATENARLKTEMERLKSDYLNYQQASCQAVEVYSAQLETSKAEVTRLKQLDSMKHNFAAQLAAKTAEQLKAQAENDSLRQQNAELSVVLEKKDKLLRLVQKHEELTGLAYEDELLEALALKPDSTALDAYVKPLVKALEQAKARLEQSALLFDDGCQIISQTLADWKACR